MFDPWYRDGLYWSIAALMLFMFLLGIIIGQYVTLG